MIACRPAVESDVGDADVRDVACPGFPKPVLSKRLFDAARPQTADQGPSGPALSRPLPNHDRSAAAGGPKDRARSTVDGEAVDGAPHIGAGPL